MFAKADIFVVLDAFRVALREAERFPEARLPVTVPTPGLDFGGLSERSGLIRRHGLVSTWRDHTDIVPRAEAEAPLLRGYQRAVHEALLDRWQILLLPHWLI